MIVGCDMLQVAVLPVNKMLQELNMNGAGGKDSSNFGQIIGAKTKSNYTCAIGDEG